MINALNAVLRNINYIVTVYTDEGQSVDGRWVNSIVPFQQGPCHVQPMPRKEIEWLERGGERLTDPKQTWLAFSPDKEPRMFSIESVDRLLLFKVLATDLRPTEGYFKLQGTLVSDTPANVGKYIITERDGKYTISEDSKFITTEVKR